MTNIALQANVEAYLTTLAEIESSQTQAAPGSAEAREIDCAVRFRDLWTQYLMDSDEGMLQVMLVEVYQHALGVDLYSDGIEAGMPLQASARSNNFDA